MTYVFDIDGTICTKVQDGDYSAAEPIRTRIDTINSLFEKGHIIVFQTARGMGRNHNDIELAYEMFYDLTQDQLCEWGVCYHALYLGKPSGDFYIDDKGLKDEDFFRDEIRT